MKGDYANGRIYKIEPICEHDENEVYYGSTCQLLCKRMDKHRTNYKCWLNGSKTYTSSYILFEKYGVENCKIYLVELYPCETKEELFAREGYHIKNNKCVNRIVAGRTQKQYYEEHCEMIKHRSKNNRQKNIEKLSTKYNCECGGKYTYESKSKHLKSTKHIEWYNEQNVEQVHDV